MILFIFAQDGANFADESHYSRSFHPHKML